jgi:hypothetical protein
MSLAEVQLTCIRRYAPELDSVPIFLATELTTYNDYVERILKIKNVHHIVLQKEESEFIESRLAAVNYLPPEYTYVLPLQEDFWLDRCPNLVRLNEAIKILDTDPKVRSLRLMPSPGPDDSDPKYGRDWRILTVRDKYRFTFQATLWRCADYSRFLEAILKSASKDFADINGQKGQWSKFCIRANVAENSKGQDIFKSVCMAPNSIHLSIERAHKSPNAVFLAAWPYRPTAVVQGTLEPWAREFLEREGFDRNIF